MLRWSGLGESMNVRRLLLASLLTSIAVATHSVAASEHQMFEAIKANSGKKSLLVAGEGTSSKVTLAAGCAIEDPESFDLEQRIAWAKRTAPCLEIEEVRLRAEALSQKGMEAAETLRKAELTRVLAAQVAQSGEARESESEFLGLEWGIGVGISRSFGDAVDSAQVVNGIVRVERDNSLKPRVLLEFHRFLRHPDPRDGAITRGSGPFVAVAASEESIAAVGGGWMWGWKDRQLPADANAFTLGVGVVVDLNVKTLGDDIHENRPLPEGETEVRFKERSRPSLMLIFTRSFD